MRRRRKPVAKPIAAATEAVIWRGRVLCEMLEAVTLPPQLEEPIRRMLDALDDYEASKVPASKVPALQIYTCQACGSGCTERTDGLCNRCYDAKVNALPFAEMGS